MKLDSFISCDHNRREFRGDRRRNHDKPVTSDMETVCHIMQRKLPDAGALYALRASAFNLPCLGVGRPVML
ncbi:hypothetical protein [Pelagibius marinus]|uniref:hypothetical protein n=1 Tax=Pelagibius marinus TaxID=2762760 RepID=UPI0018729D38|nr:hypothetical protein [Pelagibius marinus]